MGTIKTLFAVTLIFVLITMSCNNSPLDTENADAVEADKNALEIIYAPGDDANSVTKDLGLPASGQSGTTISWFSSKHSVITMYGEVIRPPIGSGDATVTLTATVSKGTASDVKVFTLIVKELNEDAQAVAADKSALVIIYATGDNNSSVTKNVGLSTGGASGSNISWATNNSNRISTTGVVNRPDSINGDTAVTLTATISKGTASDVKVFVLTVKAKGIIVAGTVTDIDGNVYRTIMIGNQEWTMENLRTTKYNDGSAILLLSDGTAWEEDTIGAYCYYENTTNGDSIKKYGALYNWYAVKTGKIAPTGWHVPTDAQWDTLQNYLITHGYNWDSTTTGNKIAKSMAAKTDWFPDSTLGSIGNDLTKNNLSGFSALPGAYRSYFGTFNYKGSDGYWWSATVSDTLNIWVRRLIFYNDYLISYDDYKSCGFSVRLVRD